MVKFGLHSNNFQKIARQSTSGGFRIFPVRVVDIILDDVSNPDLFKKYGGWGSIGTIIWQSTTNPEPKSTNIARPLYPNFLNYPLKNEIVYILPLPGPNVQTDTNDTILYYFNPINTWNSVHHNAIPDNINKSSLPPSQQKDYQQTEGGNVRKVTDGSTEISLGNTFKEYLNIRNLIPYEGDVILEGRWGNSIRFGSTVNNSKIPNEWSSNGSNGNPITILRNGQYDPSTTEPWVPILEKVNGDKSSIYLTSNQKIPIKVASEDYNSYKKSKSNDDSSYTPPSPSEYNQDQVILNSGRLLFNAYSDSILLTSQNSINLNSKGTVNIDVTKKFIISGTESPQIYLGDATEDNTEPILLGDKTIDSLTIVLNELIKVYQTLSIMVGMPPGAPFAAVINSSATALEKTIQEKNKLEDLKQKNIRIRKNP